MTQRFGKIWLFVGAAAVALLLAVVLSGVRGQRKRAASGAAPPPGQASSPGVRERGAFSPGGPVTPQARSAPTEATGLQQRAQLALDEYRKFAVYPPWSRPADAAQVHTINWNAPLSSEPVALVPPPGLKKAEDHPGEPSKDPAVFAELTLDRMFAGPGEPIIATVHVWREGKDGAREPVDAKITGAIEQWTDTKTWASLAPAEFRDAADPSAKQARLVPSSIPALSGDSGPPADTHVIAHVKAGNRSADLIAPFRSSSTAAVVVHGVTGSRIHDGSLDVDLDLDVRIAGPVRIEAVLTAADGHPIAVYTDFKRPEQTGRQTITITFFGRILAEAGVDSPYQLTSLHGFVSTNGNHTEVFWSAPASYPIDGYRASDFSSAEWSSPEKDAKIDQYQRLIQK